MLVAFLAGLLPGMGALIPSFLADRFPPIVVSIAFSFLPVTGTTIACIAGLSPWPSWIAGIGSFIMICGMLFVVTSNRHLPSHRSTTPATTKQQGVDGSSPSVEMRIMHAPAGNTGVPYGLLSASGSPLPSMEFFPMQSTQSSEPIEGVDEDRLHLGRNVPSASQPPLRLLIEVPDAYHERSHLAEAQPSDPTSCRRDKSNLNDNSHKNTHDNHDNDDSDDSYYVPMFASAFAGAALLMLPSSTSISFEENSDFSPLDDRSPSPSSLAPTTSFPFLRLSSSAGSVVSSENSSTLSLDHVESASQSVSSGQLLRIVPFVSPTPVPSSHASAVDPDPMEK